MDRPWVPGSIAFAIGMLAIGHALQIDTTSHGDHGSVAPERSMKLDTLDVSWRNLPGPALPTAASSAPPRTVGDAPVSRRQAASAERSPKARIGDSDLRVTVPDRQASGDDEAPPTIETIEARQPQTAISGETTEVSRTIETATVDKAWPGNPSPPAVQLPQAPQVQNSSTEGEGTRTASSVPAQPAQKAEVLKPIPEARTLPSLTAHADDADAVGSHPAEQPGLVIGHIPPAVVALPEEKAMKVPPPSTARAAAARSAARQRYSGEAGMDQDRPSDPDAALWGPHPKFLETLATNKP